MKKMGGMSTTKSTGGKKLMASGKRGATKSGLKRIAMKRNHHKR
jgi:hypothetical protein